jgi:hypothetical protein
MNKWLSSYFGLSTTSVVSSPDPHAPWKVDLGTRLLQVELLTIQILFICSVLDTYFTATYGCLLLWWNEWPIIPSQSILFQLEDGVWVNNSRVFGGFNSQENYTVSGLVPYQPYSFRLLGMFRNLPDGSPFAVPGPVTEFTTKGVLCVFVCMHVSTYVHLCFVQMDVNVCKCHTHFTPSHRLAPSPLTP